MDEVEEIRLFNPFTQASSMDLDHILLHSLKEVLWDNDSIEKLKPHISGQKGELILESLKLKGNFRGEELFYPLIFDTPATMQDYLGDKCVSIFLETERLASNEANMLKEYNSLYARAIDEDILVPEPSKLLKSLDTVMNARKRRMVFHNLKTEGTDSTYSLACKQGRSFFGNIVYMKEEFASLQADGYQIFVFAESESQSQRISYLLRDIAGIKVGAAAVTSGFLLAEAKIIVIGENEIFGRRKKTPTSVIKAQSEIIETFVDLDPGDTVVHVNYGIGLFKGIKRIEAAGAERDYIELGYAKEETVFIPIEQVNLIQRYIGQEGRPPRLDRMGGTSWEKKKKRAKKSVADLADRLVKLYARRQTAVGYAFPKDDDFQISFEAGIPLAGNSGSVSRHRRCQDGHGKSETHG